jgi:CheY-like chemotaxis protein
MTENEARAERSLETRPNTSAAATAGAPASTVLVVDGDRVCHRFVELALARELGVGVEAVRDATSALDLCRTQNVDLIVSETTLPDMDGLRFHGRIRQESRLRAVPFIFLSADARPRNKAVAFRAGVDDYLCKPCDAGEFAARIAAFLERQSRRRKEAQNRAYTLAGSLAAIGFPELVSIIEMGQRSGVLALSGRSLSGQVFFDHGRVVQAYAGTLGGEEAFYRLVWDTDGYFEFTPGTCTLPRDERVITHSAAALIMEGARRFDTARESGQIPAVAPVTSIRPRQPSAWPAERVVAAPIPTLAAGRAFEAALRESFTLGDLRLFDEQSLAEWTKRDGASERLHLWLVAERDAGVASLLGLAGAPLENWVLAALKPEPKLLGLAFQLRDERLLDVLLLDARDLPQFSGSLRRSPAVVVVAPPEGDLMTLGVDAHRALRSTVERVGANIVLGVGLPTLEQRLSDIGIVSNERRVVYCARGVLSDAACDLRQLILQALRLWLAGTQGGATASGAVRGALEAPQ